MRRNWCSYDRAQGVAGGSNGEVYGMAAFCRYHVLDLPVEVLEDSDARRVEVHRNPLGVVGAIVLELSSAVDGLQTTARLDRG